MKRTLWLFLMIPAIMMIAAIPAKADDAARTSLAENQLKTDLYSISCQPQEVRSVREAEAASDVPDWVRWLIIGIGALAIILCVGLLWVRADLRRRTRELAAGMADRDAKENALRESETKLRRIIEAVPEGITVADAAGIISSVNQAVVAMHGYARREEIVGSNFIDLIAEKDREKARLNFEATIREGSAHNAAYTFLKMDGAEFPAIMSAAAVKDAVGNAASLIIVVADITEQIQASEEHNKVMEYQELDKLKNAILSTVSHELRTPLASIKGYASMLLTYNERLEDAQKKEALEAIDRSTDRLTELIDHLLDMSRLDAGMLRLDWRPVKPGDIFSTAVDEAQIRAPKYRFTFTADNGLPEITGDGRRLRQVIDNLLENAVKYSPSDTDINVKVELKPEDILVSVADQGRGIPETELTKIFQRMYRIEQRMEKDPGGLGLGLSLCKALVEAHGGRIWAESRVGEGSTFYFTVPLKQKKK